MNAPTNLPPDSTGLGSRRTVAEPRLDWPESSDLPVRQGDGGGSIPIAELLEIHPAIRAEAAVELREATDSNGGLPVSQELPLAQGLLSPLTTASLPREVEGIALPSQESVPSVDGVTTVPQVGARRWGLAWWMWLPVRGVYFLFQLASLIILLAVAGSIPVLQLASLGYLLEVGRRIADRSEKRSLLPGLDQATRIGVIAAGGAICWLPVWLISDYAYSASLIEFNGGVARAWLIAAWIVSVMAVLHIAWAALRGGRWYHFCWPAPWRFIKEVWRPATWRRAEDALWHYTIGLRLPSLIWLGLRGAAGALLWLLLPATLMLIGLTANEQPGRALLGLVGFVLMTIVLMYLPFLQVQMARENRFRAMFDVRSVRRDFRRAPWAFFVAFFVTLAMALPLYLFRIESLPQELVWVPCLFFVLLTLPSRMLVGWALRRGHRDIPQRIWVSRWLAWTLQVASVPIYVLFLYLAMLTSWDGAVIFFIQHAFLVPVPFSGT